MDIAPVSRTLRRAVFLDRDGVINTKLPEDCYVTTPSEFHILPGVEEALRILKDLGYLLVVTTNQRGIGRGFMTAEDLAGVHLHMERELARRGVTLDRVCHCPHRIAEACSCRKPEPGMIIAAAVDLSVDLADSYMVGDSPSDIEAGRRAGTRTVLIGARDDVDPDARFDSLLDFALFLKKSNGLRTGCNEA
jgi:D-glycero-D-manno-heptose 1,7-bisphosphate phosphatase